MINQIDIIVKDLETNGIEAIKSFIDRKVAEQFFIDFKTVGIDYGKNPRSIGDNDRKNLAKALSGFSNSEGGVLIWGIDTNERDIANALKPINNHELFSALLNKEFSTLVIPVNTNVRNIVIPENNNSGYVATIIPKSNKAPHEYITENRFYMRAGESFRPVPYSVLAGMFGKRPAPEIVLAFSSSNDVKNNQDSIEFSFGVMLVNKGMGIAREIFVNACILGAAHMISTEVLDKQNFVGSNLNGNHTCLISKDDFKLAIEQPVQPYKFHCKIEKSIDSHIGIEFLYGAAGEPPHRLVIKHDKEKIKEMVNSIDFDEKKFVNQFLSEFLITET